MVAAIRMARAKKKDTAIRIATMSTLTQSIRMATFIRQKRKQSPMATERPTIQILQRNQGWCTLMNRGRFLLTFPQ